MAITYTHAAGDNAGSAFSSGSLTADGNVVFVDCGFRPNRVELICNDASGAVADWHATWFAGMPAGTYWRAVGTDDAISLEATGGVTIPDPDDELEDNNGFTIPAGLMANTDVVYWIAWR